MPDAPQPSASARRSFLRSILLGGGALIALAVLFSTLMRPPIPTALIGEPAPNVPLPLLDGGTMDLAEHAGDVVVLDFWATWCAPCRGSMPIVDRVVEDYADKGVHLYFVNEGEPRNLVEPFIANTGLRAPVALDTRHELGALYQAPGLPFSVIIGRDGTIETIRVGVGQDLEAELRADLDAALGDA